MSENSVGVVVATYGDLDKWTTLAGRAMRSAEAQTVKPESVLFVHDDSLDKARNKGAEHSETDWLIFLDADDELDTRYIESMLNKVDEYASGTSLLVQPSTLGVVNGHEDPFPVLIPAKHTLLQGNWLVIGTMIRRDAFLRTGGFHNLPFWEDWELFIRMWIDGAIITAAPEAIYRVFVNPQGRNNVNPEAASQLFHQVVAEYGPQAWHKGLV